MRQAIVVGLTLLVSAAAAGADKPIPQDAARMEKRSRERLEWNRQTLGAGYDRVGKKDPRWDQPAREALELAARMFSQQFDPPVRSADVHVPAKKAVDAGCDDPLIRYLHARTSVGTDFPNLEEYDRRLQDAAEAMSASAYSPYRRAVAVKVAGEVRARRPRLNKEGRPELERKLDAILDLLPKSIAEDPRNEDWEDAWYRELNGLIQAHRRLGGDYKAAFDRVDARLSGIPGIEALRLTVEVNVTDEQFRIFAARLGEARVALNRAWELRPFEPHVAGLMLTVEKGIGQGDREAMETWFERAMLTDGNDQLACWAKLDWLDPKWYGGPTTEPMMEFGRACAATRNWHNGITVLVADAHYRHWTKLPPGPQRVNYMRSPEVWNEIKAVYEEYFKHYPDDDAERSKFAMICYLGAHYPMAHAQFQALGDRLTVWTNGPRMPIERLKKARDHTATIMAKRPGAGPAA
jgi:hypothetical protein